MYGVSKVPIFNRLWVNAQLDELNQAIPAPVTLNGCECRLFQGALAITPDTLLADFTAQIADFSGYAAAAIAAFVGPGNVNGFMQGLLFSAAFLATSPFTVPNNVNGYYIVDSAGTDWIFAEEFDDVYPFAAAGDYLDLDLVLGILLNPQTFQ